jgi:hypothetical protein
MNNIFHNFGQEIISPQFTSNKILNIFNTNLTSPQVTLHVKSIINTDVCKGKAIPLQALTGPEVSSWLWLPDFKVTGT